MPCRALNSFACILGMVLCSSCRQPALGPADSLICPPVHLSLHQGAVDAEVPASYDKAEKPAASGTGPTEAEQKGTEPKRPPRTLPERLKLPSELPGADAPEIRLPPLDAPAKERQEAIRKQYPPLPDLGPNPMPQPGPEGQPLALADLQQLALNNSPVLRQAAAKVEAARGAAIQAGAHPNPSVGYEADTIGTAGGAGYQGGFVEQLIKTAGKLQLARASAIMDLLNAELALRRARSDLISQVRAGYFAVLVARENLRIALALVRFTESGLYSTFVEQAAAGVVGPYEPKLLRVLALQNRGTLIQARNRYVAAWKQLAVTLGLPGMPPTQLSGKPDMPIPVFRYDAALARVLNNHTEVLTARNTVQKARYDLELARVTPVPDVDLRVMVQKDHTGPPFAVTPSVQVGVTLPVWDLNRGNILQAEGNLRSALDEERRVGNDLTSRLAEAFERYENNRVLRDYYLSQSADAAQAYRLAVERYNTTKDQVNFLDLVTVQQTLVTAITGYLTSLGGQWTAVVDVANLLQKDELYGDAPEVIPPVAPDLRQLFDLPCCSPCEPPADAAWHVSDAAWPAAVPRKE